MSVVWSRRAAAPNDGKLASNSAGAMVECRVQAPPVVDLLDEPSDRLSRLRERRDERPGAELAAPGRLGEPSHTTLRRTGTLLRVAFE